MNGLAGSKVPRQTRRHWRDTQLRKPAGLAPNENRQTEQTLYLHTTQGGSPRMAPCAPHSCPPLLPILKPPDPPSAEASPPWYLWPHPGQRGEQVGEPSSGLRARPPPPRRTPPVQRLYQFKLHCASGLMCHLLLRRRRSRPPRINEEAVVQETADCGRQRRPRAPVSRTPSCHC